MFQPWGVEAVFNSLLKEKTPCCLRVEAISSRELGGNVRVSGLKGGIEAI